MDFNIGDQVISKLEGKYMGFSGTVLKKIENKLTGHNWYAVQIEDDIVISFRDDCIERKQDE